MYTENLFAETGYIELPYEHYIDPSQVKLLMDLWKGFCAQSIEVKLRHSFSHSGGYEFKDRSSQDYKENFHFSRSYQAFDPTGIEQSFFSHTRNFMKLLEPMVVFAGNRMNGALSVDLSELLIKEPERWTLRFLHYPQDKQPLDKILAASHVDKGVTMHITETAPGLQVWWNNSWQDANPTEGSFLSYAGLNGQYYSECAVPALCHRVINSVETNKNGRYSIVLFIDFGSVAYDKATFGWTQDRFPSGENYSLDFNEFKGYFTEAKNKVL